MGCVVKSGRGAGRRVVRLLVRDGRWHGWLAVLAAGGQVELFEHLGRRRDATHVRTLALSG